MKKLASIILVIALLIILSISLLPDSLQTDNQETGESAGIVETRTTTDTKNDSETTPAGNKPGRTQRTLSVHFIDVGQADSILIKTSSSFMLIDGGNNADGPKVVDYIKEQGITKLDYVIGTHPHEDHIGGLDEVINTFETGKIIMPKVESSTRTFESLLEEIRKKGAKVLQAKAGLKWELDAQTKCEMLSPINETYSDTNDYSAVVKLTYGNTAFLFTGDAGVTPEKEILKSGANVQADVLKVAHHGSRDATSTAFLTAVSPEWAVISVGADNDYGHPHEETLRKLEGINTFRTDQNGTIIITSDGTKISVEREKNY